jgi:protein-S-isoprenylcysteine O-methyltransferase Ste14
MAGQQKEHGPQGPRGLGWIDLPPVWLAAALVGSWHLRGIGPDLGAFGVAAGGLVAVAALVLVALAVREFARHRTTVVPHNVPAALVTTGIYARSRNPIYLADLMILGGLSLAWNAPLGLALVPILWWILDRRFVRPEEARMSGKFLAGFDAYTQRTGRWL